jgi:hypothetical protein
MAKHTLEIKDHHLNAESAQDCVLHLVFGTESLSFMAADSRGMVLALESWEYANATKPFEQFEREPRRILMEEPIFQLPFSRKHTAVFHPNVTLVPRRLFQHAALPDYFNLILKPAEYQYAYEELPEFDAYLVYATEKAQANLLAAVFPKSRIHHLAVPILRYIRSMAGISDHTVFVNLRSNIAQVAVLERQNLLLFNSYSFSAPTDLLYFILLAYDQFKLDPKHTPLTVAGNILKDSELYRILFRFVQEVRFAVPPVKFHFPPEVDTLPAHCHVDLLCLNTK